MRTVTLFTKPGCGLCNEVKAELEALRPAVPHQLSEIDITEDSELFDKYRYTIPVVQIGDIELRAPITAVQLQEALSQPSDQSAAAA